VTALTSPTLPLPGFGINGRTVVDCSLNLGMFDPELISELLDLDSYKAVTLLQITLLSSLSTTLFYQKNLLQAIFVFFLSHLVRGFLLFE
jgi:hypothetical protein